LALKGLLRFLRRFFFPQQSTKVKILNIGLDNVHVIGLADANIPRARGKENSRELCNAIHAVNTSLLHPVQCCTFFDLPDHPSASAARGIADEESKFQSLLWELTQHCDTRYISTYEPHASAAAHSNARRVTFGRCVVDNASRKDNKWLMASELALLGCACTTTLKVVLPKYAEIIVPEKLCPESDLFMSERRRPSDTEVAAQKGHMHKAVHLGAALGNIQFTPSDIVVVVNVTGHVEECAEAVPLLHPLILRPHKAL
jgi:hypothetical protein